MEKRVLAKYSIRHKQEYIFRTNRIKEMVGASMLIQDAFDFFQKTDDGQRIVPMEQSADCQFDFCSNCDGYILWEGGGNLCVLFRDRATCLRYNRRYSRWLLRESHSLTPLCAFAEVDGVD